MDQFSCDQNKVLWALLFFESGYILKWSKRIFHEESTTSNFPITLWAEFEQLFQEYFFPINATIKPVNKLEGTAYYQESHIVKDYLVKFQTLITEASCTNSHTVVVKFCYSFWAAI